ncbi:MAG: response regulator [Caulobacteraceae bacterium]|nr:response regulator [Caulobacteraceae bacterium]
MASSFPTSDDPAPTTVHVVDRDVVVRRGLNVVLRAAGLVTRTYASLTEFQDEEGVGERGCVVADLETVGTDAAELILRLRRRGRLLPLIITTAHGDVPMAVEAMRAGAWDILLKPLDAMGLLTSVRAALYAGARVSPTPDVAESGFRDLLLALSPRERLVLRGVVAGQANKLIAYELGISPRTVEAHRASMMTKTGATSLSNLVRMAMLAGL